jgi:hypothetical protein
LIEGLTAAGVKTMLRFGQVLSAPRAPVPSKTFAATSNPKTQAIREVTEAVAAKAVKPVVAKRSQDGVFSVEESWATTSCGTRGAGDAGARFAMLFPMTGPPPGRNMLAIFEMAPFKVLT